MAKKNEVYNNLGVAFYETGDLVNAKLEWEKALLHMPNDKFTRRNLANFIYSKVDKIL